MVPLASVAAIVELSRQRPSMPRSTLQQEMEIKRAAAKAKADAAEAEAKRKLQLSAAIRIQCAIRMQLAKRTVWELSRPRTSQEILAERKIVFLEHRRAARSAGYTAQISSLSQRALDNYRRRMREEREQRAAQAAKTALSPEAMVTVFTERDQVASRLRALSRRQRADSKRLQRASASFLKAKADEANEPTTGDSTPAEVAPAVGGRQRRISKDLMAMARRAARISHEAIKSLSA